MASFDPDHALAIILQAKFNEEAKKQRKREKENVPVSIGQPKASLIDPEWETTDPCPDIHGLFVAFNERFFWKRLLGVEVKWSPQMTSCAGICVYEGRNGLCSVRLSAPLLKLRPRSDLVETLLHEMIHAYLFVTNNNRDREGHGPEFHKHMDRINKEAGTHITVYHSFHAEVKVYQQHWWRCNGPCQHRGPFFGMVKRAKNRAPGPNDFWWTDHHAACGGDFTKVREPEGYASKKKGKSSKAAKPNNEKDIRNFFKKPAPVRSTSSPTSSSKVGSNIFGFNDSMPKRVSTMGGEPSQGDSVLNRVFGFHNLPSNGGSSSGRGNHSTTFGRGHVLGRGSTEGSKRSPGRGARTGGTMAIRSGGTLVLTGTQAKNKPVEKDTSPNTKLRINNFKVFSGSGFTIGGPSGSIDRSNSRLLNIGQEPQQKKQKIDEENQKPRNRGGAESCGNNEDNEVCKCLVCNERVPREEMDMHLESCEGLQNVFNNSSSEDNADEKEINAINKKYRITSCPVCALYIEGDMDTHLDECLNASGILNVNEESVIEILDEPVQIGAKSVPKPKVDDDSDVEIIEPEDRVACPICGMRFGESKINSHVNQCLDSDDDF